MPTRPSPDRTMQVRSSTHKSSNLSLVKENFFDREFSSFFPSSELSGGVLCNSIFSSSDSSAVPPILLYVVDIHRIRVAILLGQKFLAAVKF